MARPAPAVHLAERGSAQRPLSASEGSLQELLDRLVASVPGIVGAVVAHRNGLPVASSIRGRKRVELIAVSAMAALGVEAGWNIARNLDYQDPLSVTIEGALWKVVMASIPSGAAILLVMMEEPANLGLLKMSLPRVLESLDRTIARL